MIKRVISYRRIIGTFFGGFIRLTKGEEKIKMETIKDISNYGEEMELEKGLVDHIQRFL